MEGWQEKKQTKGPKEYVAVRERESMQNLGFWFLRFSWRLPASLERMNEIKWKMSQKIRLVIWARKKEPLDG